MKYAVIKTGGKQYKVSEGDVLDVERLPEEKGAVSFSDVLLFSDGTNVTVGKPLVDGVSVSGVILDSVKGEKIRVAKYKAKVRYRRVMGHRQKLSRVKIESIGKASGKATVAKETKPKTTASKKKV